MKRGLTISALCAVLQLALTPLTQAQLTTLPNGGNKHATVSEQVGLTDITINYNRPHVKGREGHVWGELIPVGYTDQGFGTSKAAPWRAGANENTTIEFSTDVKIEGQDLPAGKYGFFVAWDPASPTIIFSRNSSSWGSFFYDPKEDVLQVKVKAIPLDKSVEWLKYEFMDEKENSAVIALEWEKVMIPFTVQVDYIKNQLEAFRRELRDNKGFSWQSLNQAAQFCARYNTNLEEGLAWANASVSGTFFSEKNFTTLSTKAQILKLMGRQAEADATMKEALPIATVAEVHQYGRLLLTEKKPQEAFAVFKMNYDKHPNEFTTNMGMARGYSALGEYKKALEYMQKAQPQAPDNGNKGAIEKMIPQLQAGKDIN